MGQSNSQFTVKELNDYQELTYFTKKEILFVYQLFMSLAPDQIANDRNYRVSTDEVMNLSELKVNPFKDQICKVFSSAEDGCLSFEDFLDMMSVFSDNAPRLVKTEYAFRIFDFDGDDFIGMNDLKELIKRLIGSHELADDYLEILANNIMEEADMDKDNMLAYAEFEHIISKTPDFISSFTIRL